MQRLEALLVSVNRLFYENTSDSSYATLFFADYDDTTGRLRYVNCGHLPPLLLRGADSAPEPSRVSATTHFQSSKSPSTGRDAPLATALALGPGDILVMYTDGVTEPPIAPETSLVSSVCWRY